MMYCSQCVVSRGRNSHQGDFAPTAALMLAVDRATMQWTPQRLIHQGKHRSGKHRGADTAAGREQYPKNGYRPSLRFISLAKRYVNRAWRRPARWLQMK